MAEKTEKATPKKMRDARKKGQVAKSQDFSSAFTFIVSISATILTARSVYEQLASYFIRTFTSFGKGPDSSGNILPVLQDSIMVIFNTSFPIILITVLSGVLVSFLVVGPVFSMEAMKPDLKKLDPFANLKNMFKFKTIFELLKSIFKISGAMILIYTVVNDSLEEIVSTASLPVIGITQVFTTFLIKVVIRVGMFFLVIAVIDLIYQKRNFANQMKMEKFEVKQEYKDTEGDPHMKSKRKHTAQEIAYQEGPSAVRRAKAVVTNPIHIAVAVEYNEGKEPAPRIVVMGKGTMADLIVKAALEYHIPIMRNVPLAHTLFEKGKISDYIPEETYQAVAEILRWLSGLETADVEHLEFLK